MIRLLQKHGNSMALVFDKTMMEALGLTAETPLNITISGANLVITPANVGVSESELSDAMAKLRPRYQEMLKNLAK